MAQVIGLAGGSLKISAFSHRGACLCAGCNIKSRGYSQARLSSGFSGERIVVRKSSVALRRKPSASVIRAASQPKVVNVLNVDELDKQKTEGMPFRRTVYTFDDWKKHRSSGRYIKHLSSIASSRVVSALWPPVLFVTGISVAVVVFNSLVAAGELPEWAPVLHLNPLPFSLTVSALSFLLVFRTNASYGRFDEARKMWGLMLNRTRDLARQALSYMAKGEYEHEKPKLLQFIRHMQGFPLTYKHHFLQEGSLEEDLKTLTTLTEPEIAAILSSTHRPNYILTMASEIMSSAHINPVARLSMDTNLTTFADDIGGCERLFKTPIPVSYTRLTSRFLLLWHIFLPLGLWDSCGVLTVPVTGFIAAILFCVDEVGVLIEEPFSILALGVIAQSSRNNQQELLDMHDQMRSLVVDNNPIPESSTISEPEPEVDDGWKAPSAPAVGTSPSVVSSIFDNGSTIRTEAPRWK